MTKEAIAAACGTLLVLCQPGNAAVLITSDRDVWESAVGAFSTVDFTGFPDGTLITDQYAGLGATFTDNQDFIFLEPGFVNDGAGLNGVFDIDMVFDEPMTAIAIDFPGFAQFQLFSGGQPFYTSPAVGGGGVGFFIGLVSDQPFDFVTLSDPTGGVAVIDDLHFGPVPLPAPSALVVVALPGLLALRRRPRSSCAPRAVQSQRRS